MQARAVAANCPRSLPLGPSLGRLENTDVQHSCSSLATRNWCLRASGEPSWAIASGNWLRHSDLVATKLHLIRTEFRKSWRAEAGESRQQVAAVCYRVRKPTIEFLLVRTRKGRWTFPKGGVINGLTHAQSAALEAFEEAGVHGRIEESSFTSYILRKRGTSTPAATHAHLCEVLRLEQPQETHRTPTWFSPQHTQSSLRKQRTPEDGAELARVVERGLARIQRLLASSSDSLQRVQFEAAERGVITRTALAAYVRSSQRKTRQSPLLQLDESARKIVGIESAARRSQQ